MSNALLLDAVVKDGRIAFVDDNFYRTRSAEMVKRWGNGACLKVRIEPEEEAYTYAQLKHYYGAIVTPLSEWNGDSKVEWDDRLKAMFLSEEKKGEKSNCNRAELADFVKQCEVYAHTNHPEAFALYDNVRRQA